MGRLLEKTCAQTTLRKFGRSWPPSFLFLRHSLPCAGVFGGFPFFFPAVFLYRLPLFTQGPAFFTPFSGYLKAVL